MNSDIEKLADKIRHDRKYGIVHFFIDKALVPESEDVILLLDQFVETNGFNRLGAGWREVDYQFAHDTLVWLIGHHMSYAVVTMQEHSAKELAEAFLSFFGADARFFTNYIVSDSPESVLKHMHSYQYRSLTNASSDSGVVIVDSCHIALLWFEDDD